MKKIIALLGIAFFMGSCTTQKATKPPVDYQAPNETTSQAFFKKIENDNRFNQVKINSRVNVQVGKTIPTLDATIYIEKDRKIWMNVAVLINMARGIATPDGIKGYEKLNKTYIESDFSYINRLLNVNFIDFKSLENLLTGRAFIPVNDRDFHFSSNSQGFSLQSKKDQKINLDGKTSSYAVRMNYDTNFDLKTIEVDETSSKGNTLTVDYSGWEAQGETRFPKNVKIIIKGEKNGQILLENTKFEFTKMETPYSVPSNYTKTDIK